MSSPSELIRLVPRMLRSQVGSILATGLFLQVLNLCSGPLVARMLGVEGRGTMAMVLLLATIGAQLLTAGLSNAVAHQVAAHGGSARDALRGLLSRWLWLALLPAGAVAVTVFLVIDAPLRTPGVVALGAAITLSACWMNILRAMLRGEVAVASVNRVRVILTASYVLLVAVTFVVWRTVSVEVVLTLSLAAYVLTTVASWLYLKRPTGGTEPLRRRDVSAYARRVWLGSLGLLTVGVDYLVVGVMTTSADLGLYAVAASVSTLPGMVLAGLAAMLLPRMSALPPVEATALMRRWVLIAVLVDVVIVLAMEAIVSPAIRILFGEAFAGSVAVARVLIVAVALLALRMVLVAIVQAQGRATATSMIELFSTGLLAAAVAIGVLLDGITGAAFGFVVVAAFSCLSLTVLIRWRGMPRHRS